MYERLLDASAALGAPLRARIRGWVVASVARDTGPDIDYDRPWGDPGLFGPRSATWRIHGDFPGMMAGGVCALMLQTLHPQALAGVWDHSNFRQDILGRLHRTTAFVAGTSFAPRAEATRLIERVARIHEAVRGELPDGRAYAATDPELLTWVHATEVLSFLRGFQAYGPRRVPGKVCDRYFDETRRIAEALGARDVPRSRAEMKAYFKGMLPQLEFSARSVTVLEVLNQLELPIPAGGLARGVFLGAGAALLPLWAQRLMRRSPAQRLTDRAAGRALKLSAPLLRAALTEGVSARSCRRVGLHRSILGHW